MLTLTRSRRGFTLVEIMIVVLILAILAAIVIPKFADSSISAKTSNLQSQLQTIRGQLELFQSQHSGQYPDLSASWDILTKQSSGTETGPGSPSGSTFGPYLPSPPVNPVNSSSIVATTPSANVGWVYFSTNGALKACAPASLQGALNLTTNDAAYY